MNNKAIKEQAKALRKEKWGVLLLSDVLLFVVASIPLIGIVATPPVALGTYENFYNTLKKKPTGWQKLYGKFKDQFESSFLFGIMIIGAAIIVCIVAGLIIALLNALLNAIFSGVSGFFITLLIILLLVLAFLLFLIPTITMYEFIGFELLIENPMMKGDEALKQTAEIAKGHIMDSFVLFYSYILEIILTIITLGVYGIKLVPEVNMAFTIYVDQLIHGAGAATETVEDGITCPGCGTVNEQDAVFCEKCGNKLA